ncbi:very low-density lipoprotein receptor-like [Ostrinia nubilalis]|uniref:very low-density lipoprotein receptor-like n=1 Tax=Ostrinia nubilalis TaxID=29057 RepID=UPI0030824841
MSVAAWCALAAALSAARADSAGSALPLPQAGTPGEDATNSAGEGGLSMVTCGPDEFRCADASRCVPAAWRCDLRAHCPDASDEMDCTYNATCGPGQFRCVRSGLCIAASWRCDGDVDCGPTDTSDEDVYMCNQDFKCEGNSARCATPRDGRFDCVPVERFCDGRRDCHDDSDEWDICDNFTSSVCGSLGCALGCRPTHAGAACYCAPGHEPRDTRCVGRCTAP